jgi:hypothetical protein
VEDAAMVIASVTPAALSVIGFLANLTVTPLGNEPWLNVTLWGAPVIVSVVVVECPGAIEPEVELNFVEIPDCEVNCAVTVPEPPTVIVVEAPLGFKKVIDGVLEPQAENE